jgi:hypothetical protein
MNLIDAIAAMTPARAWVESTGQEGHILRVYPTGRGTAMTALTDPDGHPMRDGLNVHSMPIVPDEEYPIRGLDGLQARAAAHGFTIFAEDHTDE